MSETERKSAAELGVHARELKVLAGELEALGTRLLEDHGDEGSVPEEILVRVDEMRMRCDSLLGDLAGALSEAPAEPESMESDADRILVVDDDGLNRTLMKKFLDRYGHVDLAKTGPEAIALVTKAVRGGNHYRMVLLDVQMPEMDGHEALARIRGLEEVYSAAQPAVIAMMTGVRDRGSVLRAKEAGSSGYFVKPVDLDKLTTWVEGQGLKGR